MEIEKLDNLQFVINELIDNIKIHTTQERENRTQNMILLEKNINNYTSESSSYFTTHYNISRLKNIFDLLFNIIKEQDKRISSLESN
tara:strand:+ start:98 stop:358 length:261 start_codon:yes stop_codon:yes gene_type:complete